MSNEIRRLFIFLDLVATMKLADQKRVKKIMKATDLEAELIGPNMVQVVQLTNKESKMPKACVAFGLRASRSTEPEMFNWDWTLVNAKIDKVVYGRIKPKAPANPRLRLASPS